MSEYTLTFKVQTTSSQKAAALRDKCAGWLSEDPDVKVISQAMSQVSRNFRVIGVDIATKQPFIDTLEAIDAHQAESLAVGTSKTKVVATVEMVG